MLQSQLRGRGKESGEEQGREERIGDTAEEGFGDLGLHQV